MLYIFITIIGFIISMALFATAMKSGNTFHIWFAYPAAMGIILGVIVMPALEDVAENPPVATYNIPYCPQSNLTHYEYKMGSQNFLISENSTDVIRIFNEHGWINVHNEIRGQSSFWMHTDEYIIGECALG